MRCRTAETATVDAAAVCNSGASPRPADCTTAVRRRPGLVHDKSWKFGSDSVSGLGFVLFNQTVLI